MKRKTQYAVNLGDLTKSEFREPFGAVMIMLQPVIDSSHTVVQCERGRFDGAAVLIADGTDPERWNAIMDILRNGLGRMQPIPKYALRIYAGSGKTWKRI